jgi:hypothetical protein
LLLNDWEKHIPHLKQFLKLFDGQIFYHL